MGFMFISLGRSNHQPYPIHEREVRTPIRSRQQLIDTIASATVGYKLGFRCSRPDAFDEVTPSHLLPFVYC